MTRTLVAAVTALAIFAVTAERADATHSRGKCMARGDTIARNDTGRVYEREEEAEVRSLWGCTWSRIDLRTRDEGSEASDPAAGSLRAARSKR